MHVSILILESPDGHLRELAAAFAEHCPPDWRVGRVAEVGELTDLVDDESEQHVVILPVAADTPKRNGWKLIEDLRRRSELLPIVAAAEQGSVEAAARAIAAGASDFRSAARICRNASPRCWASCAACWR